MGKKNKKGNGDKVVCAVSLGCSKNLVDTEVMLGALASEGYALTGEPEAADVIIVNTCGFIDDAIEESMSVISEMAVVKSEKPNVTLVVTGCLAERLGSSLRETHPEIDILTGTSGYPDISELIENQAADHFPKKTFMHDHTNPRLLATYPWTAYLKIAEGCSNKCSYCMIPSIRGKYRSRQPDSLILEAEALASIGVKELIVIAQDTTRYGADLKLKHALPSLLKNLAAVDGIKWVRLMYAYPELVDERLAATIADTPEICAYLDMPIQHIDTHILSAMNRRGGPDAIKNAVNLLRKNVPGICLRTTVMTGFPGETETRYNRLLTFLEETRFDRLGAFSYSPQEGAPAAELPGAVPEQVKKERLAKIMHLQQKISLKINRSFEGKTIDVLVEQADAEIAEPAAGRRRRVASLWKGRSFRDAPEIDGAVFFKGKSITPGEFVKVKVSQAFEYDLAGEVVK